MPQNQSRVLPKSEKKRLLELIKMEQARRQQGYRLIAGVDEAGRGPLAGPLVTCACLVEEGELVPYVNDCKLLTPKKRENIYQDLVKHSTIRYTIGIAEPALIDEINIYQATLKAMREAVETLPERPDYVLIDGMKLTLAGLTTEKVIKGDQTCYCIAAASVIAKVERDRMMLKYHDLYPEYGFASHKGYGTEQHKKALAVYGPSPIHRKSFISIVDALKKKMAL